MGNAIQLDKAGLKYGGRKVLTDKRKIAQCVPSQAGLLSPKNDE